MDTKSRVTPSAVTPWPIGRCEFRGHSRVISAVCVPRGALSLRPSPLVSRGGWPACSDLYQAEDQQIRHGLMAAVLLVQLPPSPQGQAGIPEVRLSKDPAFPRSLQSLAEISWAMKRFVVRTTELDRAQALSPAPARMQHPALTQP